MAFSFGGSSQAQTSFGFGASSQAQGSFGFGVSAQSNPSFGFGSSQPQSQSLFGQTQPQSQSLFGQSQSLFGQMQPQSQSLFGQPQPQSQSLFGQSQSLFGAPQTSASLFGAQSQSGWGQSAAAFGGSAMFGASQPQIAQPQQPLRLPRALTEVIEKLNPLHPESKFHAALYNNVQPAEPRLPPAFSRSGALFSPFSPGPFLPRHQPPVFQVPPAMQPERKRARTTSSPKDDAHNSSDVDVNRHDDCPTRPPQAERKRELERNRRNLVNIRFVELEKELIRSGPRAEHHPERGSISSSEFVAKGKRIDKEAVLKEAAQRIASLRKEVQSQTARITSMTDEISHLRAEKLELRADKGYLRSELENARNETKRLRTDNIGLWQALRKQSVVKNYLASDQLAKIPADLFNRAKTQPVPTPATPSSSTLPASHLAPRHSTSSPLPSASQPQSSFSPTNSALMRPPADPNLHHENHRSPLHSEAILMHQTPEELSELFASYIPGVMMPPDRTALADVSTLPDLSQSISLPVSHLQNHQLQLSHLVATAQPTGDQRKMTTSGKSSHLLSTDNETDRDGESSRREKSGDDPFSDIAYCV